jgi:hypothetical protein
MYGGNKNWYKVWLGNPMGKDHFENLYVCVRHYIKTDFREICEEDVKWIQWQVLVAIIPSFQVP